MFDAEATTQDADAACRQRAEKGFRFLLSEFGHDWCQPLGEFDIHVGDDQYCMLAHASGKRFGLAVDDLRVKCGVDTITDQWLYEHGFIDDQRFAARNGGYRPGYKVLTEHARTLVSDAQLGILPV